MHVQLVLLERALVFRLVVALRAVVPSYFDVMYVGKVRLEVRLLLGFVSASFLRRASEMGWNFKRITNWRFQSSSHLLALVPLDPDVVDDLKVRR